MAKKNILVMFGGVSPEHEVSVITGLQVIENIDRGVYEPLPVYVSKQGQYFLLENLSSRHNFVGVSRKKISFGVDSQGGFIQTEGFMDKKYYPYSAYLAFHGGMGEGGAIQGLLESVLIPFTSSNKEGVIITMNKALTKQLVEAKGLRVVPGMSFLSSEIEADSELIARSILDRLGLPVIIKPVHLGSSIGIKVAHNEVELEKSILEASYIDSEILVEEFLVGFTEFNCSVRLINGVLEASEIERPLAHDEILSFADKYQRGVKKTGGSGMASLQRELPAQISETVREQIQDAAKKAFIECHCKGMVRIDFMLIKGDLYLTEVNPIPGSMAYYLWEATGIPFKQQITDLIEQSVKDAEVSKGVTLDYQTDIINRFIAD